MHTWVCLSLVLPLLPWNPNIFIGPPIFSVLFVQWLVKSAYSTSKAGFPGGASGKESTCQCRRRRRCKRDRLDTWDRKVLGGGNGNPLQYFYLQNSMNRGAWRAIVHGVAKSWTWVSTQGTSISKVVSKGSPHSFLALPQWQKQIWHPDLQLLSESENRSVVFESLRRHGYTVQGIL